MFLASSAELARDSVVLTGAEGRHAADARRLAVGERVDLTDGEGGLAECVVTGAGRGTLELAVRARRQMPEPQPAIVVVQAIPKGDRGPLAVELMTEAGVDEIIPWAAERCVVRWRGDRGERSLERWQHTAREAGKQARRSRTPGVGPLADLAAVSERVSAAALAIILDPGAPESLHELAVPHSGQVMAIVGPEGGISPAEWRVLAQAGAVGAHLGPTVLRASSAGVVAASILLSRSGRWNAP